jgi:flagellar M-ring protein FliF
MDVRNFYTSLDRPARLRLLVGVGLIVLLTAAGLWWALTPRQQLLFGNLRETDAAEIVQALDQWKVPHRIVDGGAGIEVPADQVYETRMKLVSEGIPRGGHVGFELFDDADFGVTEFAQRVNYQRALQGEIERTIAALPGVETARVHLTIRKPGLFVGDQEPSKASVALTLRPGEQLTRRQVGGIRSLVAAAVEGLSPEQVAVLGSDGSLLAGAATGAIAEGDLDTRTEAETRFEGRIRERIEALLRQVTPDQEFHVSVDVALNFDTVRQVNERLLAGGGDGNGLLTHKRVSSSGGSEANARNQNDEEADFAHGSVHEEIARAPGRIERLSIAVLLPPQLDEFEAARIQSLVAAAAGIDAERGDRLEVSRVASRGGAMNGPSMPVHVAATSPGNVAQPLVGNLLQRAAWSHWVLVGVAGLLLGLIVAFGLQRRPRALLPHEREAVLGKLRGWLAEGSPLP